MKSFKNQSKICNYCKHWLKMEKQHSARKTGYCRKIGNKPSLMDEWDVTYSDGTCKDFKKK